MYSFEHQVAAATLDDHRQFQLLDSVVGVDVRRARQQRRVHLAWPRLTRRAARRRRLAY